MIFPLSRMPFLFLFRCKPSTHTLWQLKCLLHLCGGSFLLCYLDTFYITIVHLPACLSLSLKVYLNLLRVWLCLFHSPVTWGFSVSSSRNRPWDKALTASRLFERWFQEALRKSGKEDSVEYIHNHVTVVSKWSLISLGTSERQYRTLVRLVPCKGEELGIFIHQFPSFIDWGVLALGIWARLVLYLSREHPWVESHMVDEESQWCVRVWWELRRGWMGTWRASATVHAWKIICNQYMLVEWHQWMTEWSL